ncbi:MAG: peroxidase, partial [Candidatus Aminicenantes bacterium]|nr:peroxidase [Candidatus Aminicenantes bacterium]
GATRGSWNHGEKVMIQPAVSDEAAREKYPQGWDSPKPYIRFVDQPGD